MMPAPLTPSPVVAACSYVATCRGHFSTWFTCARDLQLRGIPVTTRRYVTTARPCGRVRWRAWGGARRLPDSLDAWLVRVVAAVSLGCVDVAGGVPGTAPEGGRLRGCCLSIRGAISAPRQRTKRTTHHVTEGYAP